jgi:phosphatidylinositol alpha-1,6-mannosyltransferase
LFERHFQNLVHNPAPAKPVFYLKTAMDILIVSQDFPPERGGIQTFVLELARAFLARGHKVRVICPGKKTDPNPLPGLTDLVRIPIHSSWLFLPLLVYLPRYLKNNASITTVLYAQWPASLSEACLPKSRKQHKSFCMVMGRELLTSVLGPLSPFLMRGTFGNMQAVFPISAEVLRMTKARAPAGTKLHLVHPGVDPTYFRPVNADFLRERYALKAVAPRPLVILTLTRLVARKNVRRLIEAMPGVKAAVPEALLMIGGSGPEKPDLEMRVRELALEKTVRFLGRIADAELVAHYCLADVFALPSFSTDKDIEGFGIVFLEAGACEVAVIGSHSGGIPDAVEDGVTGLLVPAEDTQKLQTALIELLKNRERAQAMGKQARIRIESGLTWTHISDRLLTLMA